MGDVANVTPQEVLQGQKTSIGLAVNRQRFTRSNRIDPVRPIQSTADIGFK